MLGCEVVGHIGSILALYVSFSWVVRENVHLSEHKVEVISFLVSLFVGCFLSYWLAFFLMGMFRPHGLLIVAGDNLLYMSSISGLAKSLVLVANTSNQTRQVSVLLWAGICQVT